MYVCADDEDENRVLEKVNVQALLLGTLVMHVVVFLIVALIMFAFIRLRCARYAGEVLVKCRVPQFAHQ